MARGEQVAVYRGGFFSALVYGICGVVGVGLIGAIGVGLYGLNMVDRKFDHVLAAGTGIFQSLPEIRQSLPPALSDALDDRRAPEYRDQIAVAAEVIPSHDRSGSARVMLEAKNLGDEMVTLLAVRVNLKDSGGQLIRSESAYLATPFAIEDEWAGPIMASSTRRHAIRMWTNGTDAAADVEICDIRVWEADKAGAALDRQ